jgi:hypothetical protein
MKRLLIGLAVCACAFGQQTVRTSDRPAPESTEDLYFYDGSSNLEYICTADTPSVISVFGVTAALSNQPRSSIGAVTITNIVDATNTATATFSGAHGLAVGHRIVVSGGTVDTDLNGTYTVATVADSTHITFTTANVSDATYTDTGLIITTTAPRSNSNVWSIKKFSYTSTSINRGRWLNGTPAGNLACDSRTTY